jgi:hypothetical protein
MNKFKQVKAVAKCKSLRERHDCPKECNFWHAADKSRLPFCKYAYSAERNHR